MKIGALEAGGTKMVCAIGDEYGRISEQIFVPTTTPDETMPKIIEYFRDKGIEALGIASFGPVDVNKESPTYGYILKTPKPAWADYNIVGTMKEALGVPIGFDTDVNGSLLGEVTWGAAKGLTDVVYITVGTGIGGGILSGGRVVHGMLHPEMGHAIVMLILTVSPRKVILGGGVMHQMHLFPMIRRKVAEKLNRYIETGELADPENYIVPAGCNDDQGIMGAVKLGLNALTEAQ